MAILKKSDFKQMSEAQLSEKLLDLKKELMKISTQISAGTTPENPGRVGEVKKTIARIFTVLNLKKNKPNVEEKEEKKVEEKPRRKIKSNE